MILLAFVVVALCAAVSTAADWSNSLLCCQYRGSVPQCSLGGCQRGNVSAFWTVTDCAACTAVPVPPAPSATENVTTSCTYCAAPGDADCAVVEAIDRGMRCVAPNATRSDLRRFSITSEPRAPLCCWFGEALVPGNGTGACAAATTNASVSAFVEWLQLSDVEQCPLRPPCANDCSGHGRCAVTQCACSTNYFGELCDVRCDSRLCVMGRCYNDGSGRVCHCDENVTGDRCNRRIVPLTSMPTATTTAIATTTTDTNTTTTTDFQVTDTAKRASASGGALDAVSIVALSIGGLVMIILLALTFKRCISWVCEQRNEHSAKYIPLED
jgi:hypothetical protein